MGLVYAEIELINGDDLGMARRYLIDEDEVKRMHVTALVDSGSYMMAINENIQAILQFPVTGKKNAQLADGRIVECDVVTSVELKFKNRSTVCRAMVLPGDAEVLLGSIPMEDLDVIIHPSRQELIVHPDHPDQAWTRL